MGALCLTKYRQAKRYYVSKPTEETPWLPGHDDPWESDEFRLDVKGLALLFFAGVTLPLALFLRVIVSVYRTRRFGVSGLKDMFEKR